MDIAIACCQILQSLYDVYVTIKSNNSDLRRLVDRVLVFQLPLKILISQCESNVNQNEMRELTNKIGLECFCQLLNDIDEYQRKFQEKTFWRNSIKLAFRNSIAAQLNFLNDRVTHCATDLSLGLTL